MQAAVVVRREKNSMAEPIEHDSDKQSNCIITKGIPKTWSLGRCFSYARSSSNRNCGNTLRGKKRKVLTNGHVSLPLSFVRGPQRLRVPVLYLAHSLQ